MNSIPATSRLYSGCTVLFSPCRGSSFNKIIAVEDTVGDIAGKGKHTQRNACAKSVTYLTPQMFTRSKHGHKDWMCARSAAQCEGQNCRLGVLVERINYLCSHSWGESSRSEARPTEAVYMDRKVRGHAGKHVVGAKLQGLESWPPGMRKIRDLLQLFCKVMQTGTCINDTEDLCIRHPIMNQSFCRFHQVKGKTLYDLLRPLWMQFKT